MVSFLYNLNYYLDTPVNKEIPSNLTFSDDEEQFVECQSFTDLSGRFTSTSTSRSSISNIKVNRTIDVNTDANVNDTITHENISSLKFNETETLSALSDKAFEKSDNVDLEVHHDVEMLEALSSTRVETKPLEQELNNEETHDISTNKSTEVREALPVAFSDTFTPKKEEEINSSHSPDNLNVSVMEVSAIKLSITKISENFAPEIVEAQSLQNETATEITTTDDEPLTPTEISQTLEEISGEEVKKVQISEAPVDISNIALPEETEEEYYQNIDEVKHDQQLTTSMTNKTVSPNPSPLREHQEIPIEEFKPATVEDFNMPANRRNENVFTDKIQSRLEVQFKAPATPVFKPQNDGPIDEEFKTCASSCKILSNRRKILDFSVRHKNAFTNT